MRTLLAFAVAVVGLAACTDPGVESVDAEPIVTAVAAGVATTVAAPRPTSSEPPTSESIQITEPANAADAPDDTDSTQADDILVDEILAELAENGFCDPADVEATGDVGTATAMHFVVEGTPHAPCYGGDDDRLDAAWSELEALTPVEYLDDISLLAGYEACEGCDTLAFVTVLDDAGSFFLLAVDVTAAQDDPDELRLTLMHELTHVFAQDPTSQLDVDVPAGSCPTYHNGNGCVTDTSYLWAWMSSFWDADVLATFEFGEADQDDGEARCELGGDFTGSYGASSPEEDFAEVFAAYVFDVDFAGRLEEKLAFFDGYPEFRAFRDRAIDLGVDGLPNTFEGCA